MRRIFLFSGLGLLGLLFATYAPRASASPDPIELTYRAYAAGFPTLAFSIRLGLEPSGYRITLAYKTIGPAGFLFPGHALVTASGAWTEVGAAPQIFESEARWHDRSYDVLMRYQAGSPVVQRLVPTEAKRRESVPLPARADTIDTASAIALLIERVIEARGCRLEVRVFDGRRLMLLRSFPVGPSTLGPTGRSFFHGRAERCDIRGKMLAGFLRSDGPAARRRISRGAVWFARPVAGYPPLPVRIAFSARWFGTSLMYLTDIKTIGAAQRRRVALAPQSAGSPLRDPVKR